MIEVKVHIELEYETKDYCFYCTTVHSAFKTAYHHLRAIKNLMIDFKTPGTMEAEFTYGSNKILFKLNAAREIAYRRNTDPYWHPIIEAKQKTSTAQNKNQNWIIQH